MNMTDPIADMLTRIRNAGMARHQNVLIPASKMKENIARILPQCVHRQRREPCRLTVEDGVAADRQAVRSARKRAVRRHRAAGQRGVAAQRHGAGVILSRAA